MLHLLFLLLTVYSQNFVQYNSTTQRYKSVLFPHTGCYFLPNTTRDVSYLISPKYNVKKGDVQDLCLETPSLVPELNVQDSTFCQSYFCSITKPKYYQNITNKYVYSNDLNLTRTDPRIKHLLLQQYCLKCEATFSQRFDLYIQNNTCPWLEVDYCKNKCQVNQDCFVLIHDLYVCYSKQFNQFLHGDTNLINLGYLRLYGIGYLGLIGGLILFIFNIIFLIIPEIKHFKDECQTEDYKVLNLFQKVKSFFGLRSQVIFWNVCISIGYMLFGVLDIINFSSVVLTTVMLLISITIEIYTWILIVILWVDIIQKSNNFNTEISLPLKIFWVLLTISTFIIAGTGAIIYALSIIFRNNLTVFTNLNIVLAILILIIITLLILISFLLWILSIYLFFKITFVDVQNVQDLTVVTAHYFKLNLTRNIVILNIFVVPTFIVCLLLGLSVINYEIITLYVLFVCHFLGVLFSIILSLWIGITMMNIDYLKKMYFCKKD